MPTERDVTASAGSTRLAAGGAALALGAAFLAGCTGPSSQTGAGESAPPSATSTALAPTAPTPPTADDVRARGDALAAGELTLSALTSVGEASTETLDDGSVRYTVEVPGDTLPALVLTLAAPPGSSFDVQVDGSVVLRAADGSFAGGLAVPTTSTTAGMTKGRYAAVAEDVLTLTVSALGTGATATGATGTATAWFGTRMLDGADWGEREGGRSLAVHPTTWVRAGGLAAQEGVWDALVAAEPEADTTGMHDQLLCHALGAPDKEAWNLEPWRPDVGSLATLAARCNPT